MTAVLYLHSNVPEIAMLATTEQLCYINSYMPNYPLGINYAMCDMVTRFDVKKSQNQRLDHWWGVLGRCVLWEMGVSVGAEFDLFNLPDLFYAREPIKMIWKREKTKSIIVSFKYQFKMCVYDCECVSSQLVYMWRGKWEINVINFCFLFTFYNMPLSNNLCSQVKDFNQTALWILCKFQQNIIKPNQEVCFMWQFF